MIVERVKYTLWAADMDRAVRFYCEAFGGRVVKQNSVIAEVEILGSVIAVHGGGEGKRNNAAGLPAFHAEMRGHACGPAQGGSHLHNIGHAAPHGQRDVNQLPDEGL